eukprot:SAG31_NODE_8750_length_1394_cov_2.028571_1_plen_367_part_00
MPARRQEPSDDSRHSGQTWGEWMSTGLKRARDSIMSPSPSAADEQPRRRRRAQWGLNPAARTARDAVQVLPRNQQRQVVLSLLDSFGAADMPAACSHAATRLKNDPKEHQSSAELDSLLRLFDASANAVGRALGSIQPHGMRSHTPGQAPDHRDYWAARLGATDHLLDSVHAFAGRGNAGDQRGDGMRLAGHGDAPVSRTIASMLGDSSSITSEYGGHAITDRAVIGNQMAVAAMQHFPGVIAAMHQLVERDAKPALRRSFQSFGVAVSASREAWKECRTSSSMAQAQTQLGWTEAPIGPFEDLDAYREEMARPMLQDLRQESHSGIFVTWVPPNVARTCDAKRLVAAAASRHIADPYQHADPFAL